MLKRLFDIVAAIIGLIILSPVLIAIALFIKRDSEGPIFYRAKRTGKNGRPFRVFKFRTMIVNADKVGPGITGAVDPRITRMGWFLRRYKLDELPQLLNVLIGDMSFVGPRPEDPRYVALYTPIQRNVLRVRPGITSLASIQFRNESHLLTADDWETQYIRDIMPAKLAIDLHYVGQAGLLSDIKVILMTLWLLRS